jgi:2-polyprenyl-3-methyl-5-hydroxy-6-metoxy-1,4-benzoquinol methylase
MNDRLVASGWRNDELQAVATCPACGAAPGEYRYQQLHDHLESVPGEWSLRDCRGCGSLFLDPRPTPQAIGKAYASYYTHRSGAAAYVDDNGHSLLWRLANGYMNARYGSQRLPAIAAGRFMLPLMPALRQQLDFFYRGLPRVKGRLLDVGCGNGVFLLRARAAGWNVAGVEPDPLAVATARLDGLDVFEGTLDSFCDAQRFDVITSSHVIEHVHEPRVFLGRMFDLLRIDGTIWLATPNVQSMGHRWFGRAWRGLEPPRHLVVFSAQALRGLLTEVGFTDIRFHRRGRGAAYIIRASRELARRKRSEARGLPPGLVDLKASFSATAGEELVVTARKPC